MLYVLAAVFAAAQPVPAADPLAAWRGEWEGLLSNQQPGSVGAPAMVRARLSIGAPDPNIDGCSVWRTAYFPLDDVERDDPVQIKDYTLCPGAAPYTFVIDERDGADLSAALFGDVLYAPFLAGDVMLTSRYQRKGDAITHEIVSGKAAGAPVGGVVSFAPGSLQVLALDRVAVAAAAPRAVPPPHAPDKTDPPRRAPRTVPDPEAPVETPVETPAETPVESPDETPPASPEAAASDDAPPVAVVGGGTIEVPALDDLFAVAPSAVEPADVPAPEAEIAVPDELSAVAPAAEDAAAAPDPEPDADGR